MCLFIYYIRCQFHTYGKILMIDLHRRLTKHMAIQSKGADVHPHLAVGEIVSGMVRSTLGPNGLDKMLVRKTGTPVISGDANVILDELDITNPVYEIIQGHLTNGAAAVDMTTRVVLLGELISTARELMAQGIHPTTIAEGYALASQEAADALVRMSTEETIDRTILENVISTRLRSKSIFNNERELSRLISDVISTDRTAHSTNMDTTDIHRVVGGDLTDSTVIYGACIEKRRPVNSTTITLPIRDCTVLLTDDALDIDELRHESSVVITDRRRDEFVRTATKRKEAIVEVIASTGCDVVFSASRDNVDHEVLQLLAERDIAVFHQIDDEVMNKLARTTGANKTLSVNDISEEDLGYAERIGPLGFGSEEYAFLENESTGEFQTLLLRGGTEQAVKTYEVAMTECLHLIDALLEDSRVVPSGGAPELYAATMLKRRSDSVGNRTQLAIDSYADVLESIPVTLAENAGMDPLNTLIEMRNQHDEGRTSFGIDGFSGNIVDMYSEGYIEPVSPKISSVKLATETARFLLRIDEVIAMDD